METQDPGKKNKKSKKTQVEGIQVPMADGWAVVPGGSGSRVRGWTMGPGVQRFGPEANPEQQAKMFKEQEKLFKQREELFQQQEQFFRQLGTYNQQLNGLRFKMPDVNVDPDTNSAERTTVALARRSLRQSLQSPTLSDENRRVTEQALVSLEGGQAYRNAHQADRNARRAELNARQADRNTARVEAAQRRRELQGQFGAGADDVRERRQELQAQIRDAQFELMTLQREEATGGNAAGSFRGPRVPTAPPAPPAPTSSTKVRDELRCDGLISTTEKNFSFQLDDKGGRVNGRALTPAQLAKYRRLFLPTATGAGKSKSVISINVDER